MFKHYIKYAISSAIALWLTNKIVDTIDEHTDKQDRKR